MLMSDWVFSWNGRVLQDQEFNDLPDRIQRLKGLQDGIRQQLTALRKLEPLHMRLHTLSHELLPAAQQTAEVPRTKQSQLICAPLALALQPCDVHARASLGGPLCRHLRQLAFLQDAHAAFERSERRANELQSGVADAERALQVWLFICTARVWRRMLHSACAW